MKISVEFTGYARHLIGLKDIPLEFEASPTYGEIIHDLGIRFPVLIGLLIDPGGDALMSGNLFIVNGDMGTAAMDMKGRPKDGERLILMSLITGG